MSSKLVFITGATGFIGAATAQAALKEGYRLRISVRKEDQIEKLKSVFATYADQIEFVVVPDITVTGAFSKYLEGVDYVLHVASPLAGKADKQATFNAALNGTLAILRDAAKVPSIKKVVVTSSIAALQPITGVPEGGVTREENGWDLSIDPNADLETGNPWMNSVREYAASKLLANNASWDFVEKEKPDFELFSIHPSLVYGHNILQQTVKEVGGGSNSLIFGSIMNGATTDAALTSVYIGDVADVHIKCLDESVKKGTKYFVSGKPYTWKDIAEIMERDYPEVPHKLDKNSNPVLSKTDTSRVEKELGIQFVEPEKMIKEVLDQGLGLSKQ